MFKFKITKTVIGYLYYEQSKDFRWAKCERDKFDNTIHFVDSYGSWYKHTYNENNVLINTEKYINPKSYNH